MVCHKKQECAQNSNVRQYRETLLATDWPSEPAIAQEIPVMLSRRREFAECDRNDGVQSQRERQESGKCNCQTRVTQRKHNRRGNELKYR
jgi:hypothetical protein